MKICLVNFESVWKNKQENLLKKEYHIKQALSLFPETQIIVFPELSFTGYVLDKDNMILAEDINGFCVSETKKLAKKYNISIIAGFIESNNFSKPFNSAMVISKEGELITIYRKNHLFSQSLEPDLYSPGKSLSIFELASWKCGIFICFDCRFPRLFEAYKGEGVEFMIGIYNWVEGRNKKEIFEVIAKTRAHENQCFIAGVDCVGKDENVSYTGSHIISNPYCEDISITKNGIYHYANIEKNDIETISKTLPLKASYKEKYTIK